MAQAEATVILSVLLILVAALLAIARWRFEQIAPLLDPGLTKGERARLASRIAAAEVRWPSGAVRPISLPTLRRWLRSYRKGGTDELCPRRRKDQGVLRVLEPSWIDKAMSLLRERPDRPLYLIQKLLEPDAKVTRSTLNRHLRRQPGYARLRALARGEGRRTRHRRFEAPAPHVIWQADAKGPFTVRMDGGPCEVHVLTILDDKSRAVLAAIVARSPDLAAAVRVFRLAAARYGLPMKLYCDRASIFDSLAFRTGLAELGVYRIWTRPRNAPAHGKIEAWHRCLERWFVRELPHQVVKSLEHLADLLLAMVEVLYQDHRHREIRMPPRQALGDHISSRHVAIERLEQAFFVRKRVKPERKTGAVCVKTRPFRVPGWVPANRRVTIVFDPVSPERAFAEDEATGRRVALLPLFEPETRGKRPEHGPGRLQQLLDRYRGRVLPQAEAGMGLPELFELLAAAVGRRVPLSEAEADLVQAFYRRRGPFGRAPLEAALTRVGERLGPGRALAAYLVAIERRIARGEQKEEPS